MPRLNILAEGQTEEAFVNQVLAPHLADHGVFTCVHCVTTRRDRQRPDQIKRGGMRHFSKALRDLELWMAQDRRAQFTTMFDLYALPSDFPEIGIASRIIEPYGRVQRLEQALATTVGQDRLIPYIQLHEFETLLFSDATQFDWHYIEHARQIARLVDVAERVGNPELINGGEKTAPSKRIIAEIPEYAFEKATAGPLIARQIGIETMRAACSHFAAWLARLEGLTA